MNPTQHSVTTEQPPTVVPVAGILRTAAQYLQIRGWTQGGYYDFAGRRKHPRACALGAIGIAVHGQPAADPYDASLPGSAAFLNTLSAFWEYLDQVECVFDDVVNTSIGEWNDQPDMTAGQVVTALRNAGDWCYQQTLDALSDQQWDERFGGGAA